MSLKEWWLSVESESSGLVRSVGFKVVTHACELQLDLLGLARKWLYTILLTRDLVTLEISKLHANQI